MSDFFPYYSVLVHMRDIKKNDRQVPVPQTMLLTVHLPFNNNNHTLYSSKIQFKNNIKEKSKVETSHSYYCRPNRSTSTSLHFFTFFYCAIDAGP